MFTKSADLYDRIYLSFKDYESECRQIHSLLEEETVHTLLDVACGTGEHARILRHQYGYDVDGIDLDPQLIEYAQKKNPKGCFKQADMTNFRLGKRYDVVMCLFSSIGYVKTIDNVIETLKQLKNHTRQNGLILVEPWLKPGEITTGKIFLNTVESDDLSVARMAYTEVVNDISTIHFTYLIGTPGSITHEQETHELGLFQVDELLSCFDAVGLPVEYDQNGPSGRGLYIARNQ